MHNAQHSVKAKRTPVSCFLHIMDFDDRPDPAKRLEKARIARGFADAKAAAKFFGWPYDTYAQHENGTRGIIRAVDRYAKAYRVSQGWLLTGEGAGPDKGPAMLQIVGKAGAGPEGTVLFGTGDSNLGEIPAPEGVAENASVLEVEGTSMRGIAEDGWLIIYEDREDPHDEHMGEPCVCFLEDDRVLVKVPRAGSERGLFHLESMNAPPMYDVPIRHFALIVDIKPRRAAQKYLHKNPLAKVEDVTTNGRRIA